MNASNRSPRIYRYVIDHDRGFAPNPFGSFCTLGCCKPMIRKTAEVNDMIVGFGAAKYKLSGRMIYWMKVDEIIGFDDYWLDPRFQSKKPQMGGSLMTCFGDNIYHRPEGEKHSWVQEDSFHSDPASAVGAGNLRRDTSTTDRVLIGKEYAYWGGQAKLVPQRFEKVVKRGRGHTYRIDEPDLQTDFSNWLYSLEDRGFCSEPADWSRDRKLKKISASGHTDSTA